MSQAYLIMSQRYIRKISGKSQANYRKIVGKSQAYARYITDITQACLRLSLGIYQAYLRHISGKSYANLRQVSGIFQAYFRLFSDISQTYIRNKSGISQAILKHISSISHKNFRLFHANLRHISGSPQVTYTRQSPQSSHFVVIIYHYYNDIQLDPLAGSQLLDMKEIPKNNIFQVFQGAGVNFHTIWLIFVKLS